MQPGLGLKGRRGRRLAPGSVQGLRGHLLPLHRAQRRAGPVPEEEPGGQVCWQPGPALPSPASSGCYPRRRDAVRAVRRTKEMELLEANSSCSNGGCTPVRPSSAGGKREEPRGSALPAPLQRREGPGGEGRQPWLPAAGAEAAAPPGLIPPTRLWGCSLVTALFFGVWGFFSFF